MPVEGRDASVAPARLRKLESGGKEDLSCRMGAEILSLFPCLDLGPMTLGFVDLNPRTCLLETLGGVGARAIFSASGSEGNGFSRCSRIGSLEKEPTCLSDADWPRVRS